MTAMMEQLSLPVRRLLAVALLVAALGLLALMTVVPVSARIAGLREQIDTERILLGRFAAVAARQSQTAEYDRIGRAAVESGAYLRGESDALSAAALQTLLSELAAANGVRPSSTRALAARERHEVRLIGVRVQFNARVGQVQALLHRIESHRPLLFVEAMQIAPISPFSQRDAEQVGVLDVRLEIFGAVASKLGQ